MERSKKKGLFIGLAIVLLLAVGAVAVVFLLPKKADEKLFVSKISPNGVNATITASYQYEGGEETFFTNMAGNAELVLTPDIVSSKELSAPIEIKLVEDKSYIIFTFAFTNNDADLGMVASLEDTSLKTNTIVKYAVTTFRGANIFEKYTTLIEVGNNALSSIYVEPQATMYAQILVERDEADATYLSNATAGLMWTLQVSDHYEKNGWVISDGNVATAYVGGEIDLTIPAEVTIIGPEVLKNNTAITSITIPDEVTSIGEQAFAGCTSLTSVIFESTNWALDKTINDEIVREVSPNLTNAQNNAAFLKGEGANYSWSRTTTSGDYILDKDNIIIAYTGTDVALTLPEAATGINNGLFESNAQIESVTINSNLTNIGKKAFKNCTALRAITFSSTSKLKVIGGNAFEGCTSITSFVFPSSITTISANSFKNCSALTLVTMTQAQAKKATNAFTGCGEVKVRTLLSNDGYFEFASLENIPSEKIPTKLNNSINASNIPSEICTIRLPSNVTSIGDFTFSSSLESIIFPDNSNLQTIGSYAFRYTKIKTITLPSSVQSIGPSTFSTCRQLKTVTLPNNSSYTQISDGLFSYCKALESINIPDNITTIGGSAFYQCYNLSQVTFSDNSSLKTIGSNAFSDCRSLYSFAIPSTVTSIGSSAFDGCYRLVDVCNKSGITGIANGSTYGGRVGYYALNIYSNSNNSAGILTKREDGFVTFQYEEGNEDENIYLVDYLGDEKDFVLPDDITIINKYAFCYNSTMETFTISSSSNLKVVDAYAFYYCSALEHVDFDMTNSQLETIGYDAFTSCNNFLSITIPSSVTTIGPYALNATHLFEIVNDSEAVAEDIANVGEIHLTSADTRGVFSKTDDGLVLYTRGDKTYMVNYLGDGEELTIPDNITNSAKNAFSSKRAKVVNIPSVERWLSITFSPSAYSTPINYSSSSSGNNTKIMLDGKLLMFVDVPEGMEKISDYVFYNYAYLLGINIPSSVTTIGNYAFSNAGKQGLLEIKIAENSNLEIIGKSAFSSSKIKTIDLSSANSLTTIGSNAFTYSSLTSIDLGSLSALTSIGEGAFGQCNNLRKVYISDIGNWLKLDFGINCNPCYRETKPVNANYYTGDHQADLYINGELATSVVVPYGTTTLKTKAFAGVSSITKIELPSTLTEIKSLAFDTCTNITTIKISDTNDWLNIDFEYYTANPFYYSNNACLYIGDNKVTSFVIPSGTAMKPYTFYRCKGIEEITIPSNMTRDPNKNAFSSCSFKIVNVSSLSNWLSNIIEGLLYGADLYVGGEKVTSVVVPNGQTAIGNYAFYGCQSIMSVSIPSSVKTIGPYAFYGCSNLSQVIIPDDSQLTSIGYDSFMDCISLESFTIPSHVTSIGNSAFFRCNNLMEVGNKSSLNIVKGSSDYGYIAYYALDFYTESPSGAQTTTDDGFVLYSINDKVYLMGYVGLGGAIAIPDGVTNIYRTPFAANNNITSLTIPASITAISGLSDMKALQSVTFQGDITSIGSYAFSGCSSLTSITIPASIQTIENSAFAGCSSLESIDFAGLSNITSIGKLFGNNDSNIIIRLSDEQNISYLFGMTYSSSSYDGNLLYNNRLFVGNNEATTLTIPSDISSVPAYIFYGCLSIQNLVVPNTLQSIPNNAFCGMPNLVSVTFESTSKLTSIGASAFSNCKSLKTITLPKSVTNIGSSSFAGCAGLESVYLEKSSLNVTIGAGAFSNCYSLRHVDLPSNINGYIGAGAFGNCYRLVEVYMPTSTGTNTPDYELVNYSKNTATSHGSFSTTDDGFVLYSYSGKVYLIDYVGTNPVITIPSNVTDINVYAFYKNEVITSVTIPSGVRIRTTEGYYKGSSAFEGCSNMETVIFEGSGAISTLPTGTFKDCVNLKNVTLPNSVTEIGSYAFYNCRSLQSITLPTRLKTIWDGAFSGCSSLTSIALPNTLETIHAEAFRDCTSLASIVIPASVISIAASFTGCSKLTSATIEDVNDWMIGTCLIDANDLNDTYKASLYLRALSMQKPAE